MLQLSRQIAHLPRPRVNATQTRIHRGQDTLLSHFELQVNLFEDVLDFGREQFLFQRGEFAFQSEVFICQVWLVAYKVLGVLEKVLKQLVLLVIV